MGHLVRPDGTINTAPSNMKTAKIKKVYTVNSWDDDLIIDGQKFGFDPRLNEHREHLGHKSMERLVRELRNDKGEPLRYARVFCNDLNPKKIYIFSN